MRAALLSETYSALDEAAQMAIEAWGPIRGQVTVLNPDCPDADKRVVKLDTDAAVFALDSAGVEPHDRLAAMESLLMLHDVEYHGARDFPGFCADHAMNEDGPVYSYKCRKCKLYWRADGAS